eukprot:s5825_g2.t1
MSALLTYLGWDHAKVGVKAVDFAASFNALGISVQLNNLNKGSFILCNKEGRIERLCAMLEAIGSKGTISRSEAAQIQGHLNFASGFFVSKALKFLEFFQEAKTIVHPKDPQKALPDSLKEAVLQVMGHSPVDVAKHRLNVLLAVQRKSIELQEDEQRLKDSMDYRTASVLANKRLCLWRHLLEVTQFPDMEVVDLVTQGIPLYGTHTKPPNFPDDWRPSLISVDELLDSSIWRRKSLMSVEYSKQEEKVQQDLHETTMKEVELGHLHGPFSDAEVTAHFGTDKWLFNPRFALYQGSENKVRAIDDGKRSALNLCDGRFLDDQSEALASAAQLGSSCLQSDVSAASSVVSGPTMSTAMHDAVFAHNLLTNCDAVGIKLPWETDFYMDLFGETSRSSLVPKMPISDALDCDVDAGPQAVASAVASVFERTSSSLHLREVCR